VGGPCALPFSNEWEKVLEFEIVLLVIAIVVSILIALIGFVISRLLAIQHDVDDLHAWHNHKDSDGVFSWYVRKSLEERIADLTNAITDLVAVTKEQGHMLMTINQNVTTNSETIHRIEEAGRKKEVR
jgi:hypothetical protein